MSAADPHSVRNLARARFVLEEAEALNIRFEVRGGKLEVSYPLSLLDASWHSLRFGIVVNGWMIAELVLVRDGGVS
jgi:hypothetical protein